LLRKQNTKLEVAEHHKDFLEQLKSRTQAPKGLKIKVTTTTVELPRAQYLKWERAHINLANELRDILLEYWTITVQSLQQEITETIKELSELCSEEELETITSQIDRICSKKREDLKTKGNKKLSKTKRSRTEDTAGTSNQH
jgi:hypothetical protein